MIAPGTGVRVYLACGVTDMRKGIEGLAVLTQDVAAPDADRGCGLCLSGAYGRPAEAALLGRSGVLPILQGA